MFLRELRIPFGTAHVVRRNDTPTQVIAYVCWRALGPELEILNVAVAPREQQRGIGRFLVELAIAAAYAAAAETIHLEVREDNHAGMALYERCGFARTGIRRHYYGRDQHAVLMSWRPSPPTSSPVE